MAALASDWLRHFLLLLWNGWTEFKETWQEARSQRPLPILCFSSRSEKSIWPLWPLIDWDIFWLFLWNCWMEFSETWHEVRSQRMICLVLQRPLPSLCFSGRKVNRKMLPWPIRKKKVAHCTQIHVMWPFGPLVNTISKDFYAVKCLIYI